jgi:hypothetical protein
MKLAPYLPEAERDQILQETIAAIIRTVEDDSWVMRITPTPYLPEAEREQALQGELATIRAFKDDSWKLSRLMRLASYLLETGRDQGLQEALTLAQTVRGEGRLVAALMLLVPAYFAQLPSATLYPLWRKALPHLAAGTRQDLLANISTSAPVIIALGGPQAVAETFRAIQDVGRWWP